MEVIRRQFLVKFGGKRVKNVIQRNRTFNQVMASGKILK